MTLNDRELAALRVILHKPHSDDAGDPPTAHEVLWTIHVGDDPWTLACDGYMALCLHGISGEPPNDARINPRTMLTTIQNWIAERKPVLFTVPAEQARAWARGEPFCHECGGTGRRLCTSCDRSGRVVLKEKCEQCGHEHHCEYKCGCKEGKRECRHCQGKGRPSFEDSEAEDRSGIIGDMVLDRKRAGQLLAVADGDVAVSVGVSKWGFVSFSGDGWVAFLSPLNREYIDATTPAIAPRLGPVSRETP